MPTKAEWDRFAEQSGLARYTLPAGDDVAAASPETVESKPQPQRAVDALSLPAPLTDEEWAAILPNLPAAHRKKGQGQRTWRSRLYQRLSLVRGGEPARLWLAASAESFPEPVHLRVTPFSLVECRRLPGALLGGEGRSSPVAFPTEPVPLARSGRRATAR